MVGKCNDIFEQLQGGVHQEKPENTGYCHLNCAAVSPTFMEPKAYDLHQWVRGGWRAALRADGRDE